MELATNFQLPFYLHRYLIVPDLNQIHIDDKVLKMEPKITQTLILLAKNQGQLVSRDQLLDHVWKNQVVGDEVITRIIFQLRKLFNDKARNPQFIATISKKGYQLLPRPIAADNLEQRSSQVTQLDKARGTSSKKQLHVKKNSPENEKEALYNKHYLFRNTGISTSLRFRLAITCLFLLLAGAYFPYDYNDVPSIEFANSSETYLKGREADTSFSPDGKWMAFVNVETTFDYINLYLKELASGNISKLTHSDADDRFPVWSKDSQQLYFSRCKSDNQCDLVVRHLINGEESIVYQSKNHIENLTISYSENKLVFSESTLGNVKSSHLKVLDLATLSITRLFDEKNNQSLSHRHPVFKGNKSQLAFLVHSVDSTEIQISLYDFPTNTIKKIFSTPLPVANFTIAAESERLYLSIEKEGKWGLWSSSYYTNRLTPVLVNNEDSLLLQPVLNSDDSTLFFQSFKKNRREIYQLSLETKNTVPLISSSQLDEHAVISNTGNLVVFNSDRSGSLELWLATIDGGNQRRLSHLNKNIWAINKTIWLSDDKHILFTTLSLEGEKVYILDSYTGEVTFEYSLGNTGDSTFLTISSDNKSLLVAKKSESNIHLYRLYLAQLSEKLITKNAGLAAYESSDGKFLYYHESNTGTLKRLDLITREEVSVSQHITFQKDPLRMPLFVGKRVLFNDNSFYFINAESTLKRIDLSSGEQFTILNNLHATTLLSGASSGDDIILFDTMLYGQSDIRSLNIEN